MSDFKNTCRDLLQSIDITINGNRPHDIQILDESLYSRVLQDYTIGFGEAYMDGLWECEALDQFFTKILQANIQNRFKLNWKMKGQLLGHKLLNMQTKNRSIKVAEEHYNLGNTLYEYMLGPSMAYTCAYYKNTDTLDEAQYAKYDLICKKLNLQSHHRVLELGCGFGGFAKYAAKHYGCEVVAVNISKEQLRFARAHSDDLPITFVEADYRDTHLYNPAGSRFDRIVSIGLCEHVGHKNYQDLFNIARANIKSDGLFLLHTIGNNISKYGADPWINKYIFPNGCIPSIQQLSQAMESTFVMEDWHNFGPYYDLTLMAWDANFRKHWDQIASDYDQRFYRMWRYYLLQCAGAFRARGLQLWQIILSPPGALSRGYEQVSYSERY